MADEEVFQDTDFRFVTVVDRVGTGGPIRLASGAVIPGEFWFGGVPVTIKHKFRLRAPAAIHVFRSLNQSTFVHTTDGQFVNRLGVLSDPELSDPDLVRDLGPECTECDPIDVDLEMIEGWDVESVDPTRRETIKKRLMTMIRVPRNELMTSDQSGGKASFGKE